MEKITYGFYQSPVGRMVIGISAKGLCWLGFMVEGYKGNGLDRMKSFFTKANFIHDDASVEEMANKIIRSWESDDLNAISLDLRGSEFQLSVWKALLSIPKGDVCHYGDIANDIGRPKAARAVGTAVGDNPVSLIVPCHRVVPAGGGIGNYGWGADVKEAILTLESKV